MAAAREAGVTVLLDGQGPTSCSAATPGVNGVALAIDRRGLRWLKGLTWGATAASVLARRTSRPHSPGAARLYRLRRPSPRTSP